MGREWAGGGGRLEVGVGVGGWGLRWEVGGWGCWEIPWKVPSQLTNYLGTWQADQDTFFEHCFSGDPPSGFMLNGGRVAVGGVVGPIFDHLWSLKTEARKGDWQFRHDTARKLAFPMTVALSQKFSELFLPELRVPNDPDMAQTRVLAQVRGDRQSGRKSPSGLETETW